MGSNTTKINNQNLSSHEPPLDEYQLISSGCNFFLWQNQLFKNSLLQYQFSPINDQMIKDNLQSYFWRYRHYLLVSTLFFKKNEQQSKYSIFYQRVFTNLSRIKDLCFQDSLQFYYIGLKGFQILYKSFGFFEVQENMFHITQQNKIKVWCDHNISRIYPSAVGGGSQQAMVRKIIAIINSNTDHSKIKIPIGNLLSKEPSLNFKKAINKLKDICKLYKLSIPSQLKCLQTLCDGHAQNIVDQFGGREISEYLAINQNRTIPYNTTTTNTNDCSHLIKNYQFVLPPTQKPVKQFHRPHYYSQPKNHPKQYMIKVHSNNHPPNKIITIVRNPIQREDKKTKSLDTYLHKNTSQVKFLQQSIVNNTHVNNLNKKYIYKAQNTKRQITADINEKSSESHITDNQTINQNNILKRSKIIQSIPEQHLLTTSKKLPQLKKSSRVNFKFCYGTSNLNQHQKITQQKKIDQFTLNNKILDKFYTDVQSTSKHSENNISNGLFISDIKDPNKIQTDEQSILLPPLASSPTLLQLQQRYNTLHQKLIKNKTTNYKHSSLPFTPTSHPSNQNPLSFPHHSNSQPNFDINQIVETSSRQEFISIERQLKQQKNNQNNNLYGKTRNTISTIQSGKMLENQAKMSNIDNFGQMGDRLGQNCKMKIMKNNIEQVNKKEQKNSKTKKYSPTIDDDIWKDMLKIKQQC